MNASLDPKIPLQAALPPSLQWRSGSHVGHAGAGEVGNARKEEAAEAFGKRLYRIRTAVNHAIEAYYQSLAGEVNADKLRMLVEDLGEDTIRVGNYTIQQCKK